VDQLIRTGTTEGKKQEIKEDVRKVIEEERELATSLHETGKTDEMCDGGG
jgi:hypothetical protein